MAEEFFEFLELGGRHEFVIFLWIVVAIGQCSCCHFDVGRAAGLLLILCSSSDGRHGPFVPLQFCPSRGCGWALAFFCLYDGVVGTEFPGLCFESRCTSCALCLLQVPCRRHHRTIVVSSMLEKSDCFLTRSSGWCHVTSSPLL